MEKTPQQLKYDKMQRIRSKAQKEARIRHEKRKAHVPTAVEDLERREFAPKKVRGLNIKESNGSIGYGILKFEIRDLITDEVKKQGRIILTKKGLKNVHGPFFNNVIAARLKKEKIVEYISVSGNYKVAYELEL